MLRLLTPHLQLDRVVELDVGDLHARGIEGLLLDVDCTLKDHYAPAPLPEVALWMDKLRAGGIRLCLLSNGVPGRIAPLAASLGVEAVARAFKPLPLGCRAGLCRLGLPAERVALVGDQVFTDVLAGRLAGLFTILVRPTTIHEPWFTRLKRPLERRLLRRLSGPSPFLSPGRPQNRHP
jgi:HAD superfamily phosphatase (TIGR01668 family)